MKAVLLLVAFAILLQVACSSQSENEVVERVQREAGQQFINQKKKTTRKSDRKNKVKFNLLLAILK